MISHTTEETKAAGRALADHIQPGDFILLTGPLGSGKTTFVQGLAEGLAAGSLVTSPSFVIVREYPLTARNRGPAAREKGGRVLRHIDLYRLSDPAVDLDRIGLTELLQDPDAITVIEWADKLSSRPGGCVYQVRLAHGPEPATRDIVVEGPLEPISYIPFLLQCVKSGCKPLIARLRIQRIRLPGTYAVFAWDFAHFVTESIYEMGSSVKRISAILLAALGVLVVIGAFRLANRSEEPRRDSVEPRAPTIEVPTPQATTSPQSEPAHGIRVVATNLEIPWALAFAPDGALYVTERSGRLVRIRDGTVEKVADIPDVAHVGEGGLLGLALDPRFSENQFLYLYHTYDAHGLKNRVVRYRVTNEGLKDQKILLDATPGAQFHDGGRIAVGPDGNLYVTTGDASNGDLAQRLDSLAGKILRIRSDGAIPADNPFPGSPVYSLGHRNPQGLAWSVDGKLYSTEHGPSGPGSNCCHDEINIIEAGKNYGWPTKVGWSSPPDPVFVSPLGESGANATWAPGGAAVLGDTLYFGGLRGEGLYAFDLILKGQGAYMNPYVFFRKQFGRIRDVVRGPDGALYFSTSNRDGRGKPVSDDDRIIRVDQGALSP